MENKNLTSDNISALRNEKGNICISVIVPTHRFSPERKSDKTEVVKALVNAKQLLQNKYPEADIKVLLERMDELLETIDFTRNMEGLGLYISHAVKLSVQFPFPVQEKVMVNDNFELRDLIYMDNYADTYYILLLTEQVGRLFKGSWNTLFEIKDNHFPMAHKDDYVYAKPVRSSSYAGHAHVKNFEKDKSELETIRLRDFFRKLDKILDNYLVNGIPLIVLGVEKELSLFTGVSKHVEKIVGKIAGSYNYENEKVLADITWPVMRLHLENKRKTMVKEFEEKIGEGLGLSGIQEVWAAAREGKAFNLLVEKDYRQPGFLAENEYHLYIHPTKKANRVLADAVDDIIETVLEKSGHVYFVDNGILKDHQRIALITRY